MDLWKLNQDMEAHVVRCEIPGHQKHTLNPVMFDLTCMNPFLGDDGYPFGLGGLDRKRPRNDLAEREDIDWEFRLQGTGAAGRLDKYKLPDNPKFDIKQRVMVAAVSDDEKAYRTGVKAGDVPFSIGCDREFTSQSAVEVQLHAEVRKGCLATTCGFSLSLRVVWRTPLLLSMRCVSTL